MLPTGDDTYFYFASYHIVVEIFCIFQFNHLVSHMTSNSYGSVKSPERGCSQSMIKWYLCNFNT